MTEKGIVMADIKIMVDTSADLPKELSEQYDIGTISFLALFGDKSYVSGVDISNEEFYEKIKKEGIHPTTSQTPYADLYDCLLKGSREHDTVIYFTISSKGSGQNHTAHMAADEIKEDENPNADIRIEDSMSYSMYIADTAVYAAKLAKKGASADEILKKCRERIKRWEVYIIVDDLKYLEKGGRITKTSSCIY